MFLTEDESSQRLKRSNEKQMSSRSCSTASTSSGDEIMPESGSPTALMRALIRDLAFEDALPTTKALPFPSEPQLQRGKRSSSVNSMGSSSRSQTYQYSSSTADSNSQHRKSQRENIRKNKATIDESRPFEGARGRQQTVWKSAVDPMTGRTYWYDAITRRTQWDKVRS